METQNYFETFCKVSNAFGSTRDKDKLLDLIVESAVETMDGKAACLFCIDSETDLFMPTAQMGLSENYLHANPVQAKKLVDGLEKNGFLAFLEATTDPRLENHDAKKAEKRKKFFGDLYNTNSFKIRFIILLVIV